MDSRVESGRLEVRACAVNQVFLSKFFNQIKRKCGASLHNVIYAVRECFESDANILFNVLDKPLFRLLLAMVIDVNGLPSFFSLTLLVDSCFSST